MGGLGVEGNMILKWISRKQDERAWIGFVWFKTQLEGSLLTQ